jgi:methyl-accepting chemotaxis protein
MFKNIRLGAKLASGFAAVAVLAVIVGGSAYVLIGKLNREATFADRANAIKQACLEARRQEKNYVIRKGEEDFKLWQKAIEDIRTGIADALSAAGDKETREHLPESVKVVNRYKGLADNLREVTLNATRLDDEMREGARALEAHLKKIKDSGPAIIGLLHARRQEKNIILYQDKKLHEGEKNYLEKWKDAMAGVEKWSAADDGLKKLSAEYSRLISERVDTIKRAKLIDSNMVDCARSLLKGIDQMLEKARKSMENLQIAARNLILSILGICIVVAAALAFFLTRGITKPVQRIIEGLSEGASQQASG